MTRGTGFGRYGCKFVKTPRDFSFIVGFLAISVVNHSTFIFWGF